MLQPISRFLPWFDACPGRFDALLLDVDGVLMTSGNALPGARDLVRYLRGRSFPFLLLTNDGCSSPEEKIDHLNRAGFDFRVEELVSCGHALEEAARDRAWRGRRFLTLGSLGSPCYAEAAGMVLTRNPDDAHACDGIVIGEKEYDWEKMITAGFNFLVRNPAAPVVVPNPDVYFPVAGGGLHPASGATAAFLGFLCRTYGFEPNVVFTGKPYAPIFRHAHAVLESRLGRPVPIRRMLMLGDSLASDIAGGIGYGCRTGLLLTGITREHMIPAEGDGRPDDVFASL